MHKSSWRVESPEERECERPLNLKSFARFLRKTWKFARHRLAPPNADSRSSGKLFCLWGNWLKGPTLEVVPHRVRYCQRIKSCFLGLLSRCCSWRTVVTNLSKPSVTKQYHLNVLTYKKLDWTILTVMLQPQLSRPIFLHVQQSWAEWWMRVATVHLCWREINSLASANSLPTKGTTE